MTEPYSVIKDHERVALFVNTIEKPHSEYPLNHYCYTVHGKSGNEYRFSQLYRIGYLWDKGNDGAMEYFIYDWKEIKIKPECEANLKLLCDSMKAVPTFMENSPAFLQNNT